MDLEEKHHYKLKSLKPIYSKKSLLELWLIIKIECSNHWMCLATNLIT